MAIFSSSIVDMLAVATNASDVTHKTGKAWSSNALAILSCDGIAKVIDDGLLDLRCQNEVATKAAWDTIRAAEAKRKDAMADLVKKVAAMYMEARDV